MQKKVTDGGTVQYTENYLGPYTYKTMGSGTTVSANDFSYLTTSKGRWVKNGSGTYVHEFFLKDHLGNTRVVYSDDNNDGTINPATEVKQYASYYPFGMMHYKAGTLADDNRKLYNGKEFQSDLNLDWYDYGARMYDAQLGRFNTLDRFAEKYRRWTPYMYCKDNPIRFIDINGDSLNVNDQSTNNTATQKFKETNNKGTEGFYDTKIDKNGNVTFESTGKNGPMTDKATSYYNNMQKIIADKKTTSINLVDLSNKVGIGDQKTATIDMGDIQRIPDGKINSCGVLLHESTEQYAIQAKGARAEGAHNYASGVEGEYYQGMGANPVVTERIPMVGISNNDGKKFSDNGNGYYWIEVGGTNVIIDYYDNNVVNVVGN